MQKNYKEIFRLPYIQEYMDLNKALGTEYGQTDFALAMGSGSHRDYVPSNKNVTYITNTHSSQDNMYSINFETDTIVGVPTNDNTLGIKVAVRYSDVQSLMKEETQDNGLIIGYMGSYIDRALSSSEAGLIEDAITLDKYSALKSDKLVPTNVTYQVLETKRLTHSVMFSKKMLKSVVIGGKRYVKMQSYNKQGITLENGEVLMPNEEYWFEVTPIAWLIDKETNTAVTIKGIISGLPFGWNDTIFTAPDESVISFYLNTIFANDIFEGRLFEDVLEQSESFGRVRINK